MKFAKKHWFIILMVIATLLEIIYEGLYESQEADMQNFGAEAPPFYILHHILVIPWGIVMLLLIIVHIENLQASGK